LKTQKFFVPFYLLLTFAAALAFSSCPAEPDDPGQEKHAPWGSPPYNGAPLQGTAATTIPDEQGNFAAGTITIELTFQDGVITGAAFPVSTGQTPGYGSNVIAKAPDIIIATNTTESIVPDAISKPTAKITCEAVRKAGRQALEKIPGVSF
jgi:hypothetical protein